VLIIKILSCGNRRELHGAEKLGIVGLKISLSLTVNFVREYMRWYQKYSGLVQPSVQQFGSAKHRFQQIKLLIPDSTSTFCGDCKKTCEDVARTLARTDLVASA
jgi:hypothetical protein